MSPAESTPECESAEPVLLDEGARAREVRRLFFNVPACVRGSVGEVVMTLVVVDANGGGAVDVSIRHDCK
jgi:hypothetical protein